MAASVSVSELVLAHQRRASSLGKVAVGTLLFVVDGVTLPADVVDCPAVDGAGVERQHGVWHTAARGVQVCVLCTVTAAAAMHPRLGRCPAARHPHTDGVMASLTQQLLWAVGRRGDAAPQHSHLFSLLRDAAWNACRCGGACAVLAAVHSDVRL
jgi:hypothetical protein